MTAAPAARVTPAEAGRVISADGTAIGYDKSGTGPAVVLVQGALMDRADPVMSAIAAGLAQWFSVFNYDRRGHGDSGDTPPYAVEREIEDVTAVIEVAGGSAKVFGGSSGAALALRAAAGNPAISRLALWEPPYHVDDTAPQLPTGLASQLRKLVSDGRRGEAVELFMVAAVQATPDTVAEMRAQPFWPQLEAAAETLAYEADVMGQGSELPAGLLAAVTTPTLVLNGGDSPGWMTSAGTAVARAVGAGVQVILAGQAHDVAPSALIPALREFFAVP